MIFYGVMKILCLILLIRNPLVYRYKLRATDELYKYQINMIDTNVSKHTHETWNLLNKPSYITMVFMVTCWTYKSFYGNLQQRMKEITDAQ
jgi:hypothetical protein